MRCEKTNLPRWAPPPFSLLSSSRPPRPPPARGHRLRVRAAMPPEEKATGRPHRCGRSPLPPLTSRATLLLPAPTKRSGTWRRRWWTWASSARAVGPLAPMADAVGNRGGEVDVTTAELCTWLDGFTEASVVYVCLGSMAVL